MVCADLGILHYPKAAQQWLGYAGVKELQHHDTSDPSTWAPNVPYVSAEFKKLTISGLYLLNAPTGGLGLVFQGKHNTN